MFTISMVQMYIGNGELAPRTLNDSLLLFIAKRSELCLFLQNEIVTLINLPPLHLHPLRSSCQILVQKHLSSGSHTASCGPGTLHDV